MTSARTATGAVRSAAFAALDEPVDVLVIGGGVNGLAVAWDAALAGLGVVVIDKGDWGSGTSSWSSRMIHGGLKYLEKLEVRLVRESLRDREWLLRHASHLVKPLPFVLPSYRGDAHSRAAIRLGMLAYDVLSFDKSTPRHENFTRQDVMERLPGLRSEGLQGASRYYDAQVEYAERLSVELMLGARAAGAIPINYATATALELDGNRVVGARVVDGLSGSSHVVRSSVTINLTGAWVDGVLAGTPLASARLIGGTKGTHIVVEPFDGAPGDAIYYESRDHRPMMVIPWLGRYLIGSTDKAFTGDPDTATADAEEIEYILFETNKAFPSARLTPDEILYWYTGVRPLPFVSGGRPADVSRRHEVIDHAPGVDGLISVVGGKLTTFRALAEHTLKVVRRKIPAGPSRLGEQRFPGAAPEHGGNPASSPDRLTRIYGRRASEIRALMLAEPETARELDGATGLLAAEVVFGVREEQAVRLSDILARRTMVGLEPDLGRIAARPAAAAAAPELGWSESDIERELAAHERYVQRFEVMEGVA